MLMQRRRYHFSTTRCYLSSIPALDAVDRHRLILVAICGALSDRIGRGRCSSLLRKLLPHACAAKVGTACPKEKLKQTHLKQASEIEYST